MVRVSLKGGKRINMDATRDKDERRPTAFVTIDNLCEAYARRSNENAWTDMYPEIKKCNLQEFAKGYGFFPEKNMLIKLTTKVFVSFYPKGCRNYKVVTM